MVAGDRVFTWDEFAARVACGAGVLVALGVGAGDRFGILATNSVRQAELLHAGYRIGAVPVPVNYRLAPIEIRAILDDAACRLLVVESCFFGLLDSEALRGWRSRAMQLDPTGYATGLTDYETEMARGYPAPCGEPREQDEALLLYTGGTTGRSKGVPLTQRNLATVAIQNAATLTPLPTDVYLHVAPMFHSADLLGNAFMANGAAHAYLARPSARTMLETIARLRITAVVVPPTLLVLALRDESFGRFDLSSLRILVFGSAPMPEHWIAAACDALPEVELWHGYGLTETAQMLTLGRVPRKSEGAATHDSHRVRSAGRPLVGTDLRIVNDCGDEQPPDRAGEVIARGPQIGRGYLNLPAETARQFRDGWFFTGDVGSVDRDGYLYLLDRKKDMVITGGENVYCFEVEETLARHPDVVEAAVFGVPDDVYGEALMAVLVRREGSMISAQDVIDHCRSSIGGYKIPRRIVFSAELPRNALGKIVKSELRQRYARGFDSR